MRFDAKCADCIFFRLKNLPTNLECANNDGTTWNPSEKACDNFSVRRRAR